MNGPHQDCPFVFFDASSGSYLEFARLTCWPRLLVGPSPYIPKRILTYSVLD